MKTYEEHRIYISATVPRRHELRVHNVFRGPCHDVPGWNEDCLRAPPPRSRGLPECLAWLFFNDFSSEFLDRLFSDFGAQLLPKSSQNPLKMETKSNPSALRRKTYKFQWLSQFSRLFPERPTCLNYCKYQCRMTFRSFRFTSKNNKKMFKNLFKNLPKST